MAYKNLHFCWHGVVSTDVTKAQAFYTETIGWKAQSVQMGDSESTMFVAADMPRAHLGSPSMAGIPSHWDNYLRVEDVDATAAAAAANGGVVVVPGTDIPPGRFAMVTSPSGAMLAIFRELDPTATNAPKTGAGSIHWVELHSKDLDADLAWLKSTFGATTSPIDMPDGAVYQMLHDTDGTPFGGAMAGRSPEMPSMWLAWVAVDDVDAALARATTLGGNALSRVMDMHTVGRMAVVQDNTGGVFGLIQPAEGA